MFSSFMVYLIHVLDHIHVALSILTLLLCGSVAFITTLKHTDKSDREKIKDYSEKSAIFRMLSDPNLSLLLIFILSLILIFMPTKSTLIDMLIINSINNQSVKSDGLILEEIEVYKARVYRYLEEDDISCKCCTKSHLNSKNK